LRDFVYGGVDGVVTTFAVVSGVAGAGLSSGIIVVLGVANLVADGFSMAVGNFLGTRAERERLTRIREVESEHIRLCPEGEEEEIRQIFAAKGFSGKPLEYAVNVVTADRNRWIDTMIREEYGLSLNQPSPWRAAAITFGSFLVLGSIPLLAFIVNLQSTAAAERTYFSSSLLTVIALFLIGAIKAKLVSRKWYRGGLETVVVGGAAAGLAFLVGAILGPWI
jgi:VIT1/CCC1 family predicted Fe2+/Mn2+ transporter